MSFIPYKSIVAEQDNESRNNNSLIFELFAEGFFFILIFYVLYFNFFLVINYVFVQEWIENSTTIVKTERDISNTANGICKKKIRLEDGAEDINSEKDFKENNTEELNELNELSVEGAKEKKKQFDSELLVFLHYFDHTTKIIRFFFLFFFRPLLLKILWMLCFITWNSFQ